MNGRRTSAVMIAGAIVLAGCSGAEVPATEPLADGADIPLVAGPEPGSPTQTPPDPTTAPPEVTEPPEQPDPPEDDEQVADWPDLLDDVRNGVARISTTDCFDSPAGTGTGFLISDDLLVTAAHVVDGRPGLIASLGGTDHAASVIGLDPVQDLALLQLDRGADGYLFGFVDADPRLAEEVAALGYPFGSLELVFSRGAVSALDVVTDEASGVTWPVTQTDAAVNPGNSGGPLILQDGSVAGVVVNKRAWYPVGDEDLIPVEGTSFAVSGLHVAEVIAEWAANPQTIDDPCSGDIGAFQMAIEVLSDHEQAGDVGEILSTYGNSVNAGDWETVWWLNSGPLQDAIGPYDYWVSQMITSWWIDVLVLDVWTEGDRIFADAAVRTEQAPSHGPHGQACSDWVLRYEFIPEGSTWLIDQVTLAPWAGDQNPMEC